jgi:tight adherence protein B
VPPVLPGVVVEPVIERRGAAMNPFLARVILVLLLIVVGAAVTLMLVLRSKKQAKAYEDRLEFVVGSYRSSWSSTAPAVFQLTRKLTSSAPLDRIARLLSYDKTRQMYYPVRFPVVLFLCMALGVALSYAASLFVGDVAWFGVPEIAVMSCRMFYSRCEAGVLNKLYAQFPDTLAMIVRSVRIGLPVVESIRIVAMESSEPTKREFKNLVDQTAIGVPLDQALREMAVRNGLPEYRFFATALSLQSQTGGALSETLENLADTIRKRVAAKLKGRAMASEARTSSYILSGLPIVTGAALSVFTPDYMGLLLFDDLGRKILVLAIVMLGLGIFIMQTIIRKSLS